MNILKIIKSAPNKNKKFSNVIRVIALVIYVLVGVTSYSFAQKIEGGVTNNGIVVCGNRGQKSCSIDDIFKQSDAVSDFILKVIFPGVFMFGVFMVALPLVNQFSGGANAEGLALAKKRAKYLAVGSAFTLGAFFIVQAILSSAGYKSIENITNPINNNSAAVTSFIFIEKAHAAPGDNSGLLGFLPNPLGDTTVQNIIIGVANVFAFIIITLSILAIVRGVMYLMLTQENPGNLEKGKRWILGGFGAAALVLGFQLFYSIIVDTMTSLFKK